MRDGVAVNALDFEEGGAHMVISSFMLATVDGPLLHVLHCRVPPSDEASLAQARAIVEGMQFTAAQARTE
jgi:hypothetical protein